MIVQNTSEKDILRKGGRILGNILAELVTLALPGKSAADLEKRAEELIVKAGGLPSFKGYRGKGDKNQYPASICVSVNDELVHALPAADKIFKDADLIGIDIGMKWPQKEGFYTDTAVTVAVGEISEDARRLLSATQNSLELAIKMLKPGIKIGDLGFAIQKHLEKNRLGVVRSLAGHGVGRAVHEEPLIPNYGKPGTGLELKEGMVIAIEPMATLGSGEVKLGSDGWTFKASDGTLAAHFEHTILITSKGIEVLTAPGSVL